MKFPRIKITSATADNGQVVDSTTQKFNRSAALWAGISLLVMAVAAGIAYGALHSTLVIPGDAGATSAIIRENLGSFIAEIILWLVIAVTDAIVAIALFRLYETSGRVSRAAMMFRLAYTAVLVAGIGFLVAAAIGSQSGDGQTVLTHIEMFEKLWSIGLVIFGGHLFLLGLSAMRSRFTPLLFSLLLLFAGVAYSIIHVLLNLSANAAAVGTQIESALAAPMALAEMLLALWLIIRGSGISFALRKRQPADSAARS